MPIVNKGAATLPEEQEMKTSSRFHRVVTFAFAAVFAAVSAQAGSYVWTGGGSKTTWETLANWSVDGETPATALPGEEDDVTIPVGAAEGTDVTMSLSTARTIHSLTVSSGAGTLTFTVSQPLTIASGGLTIPAGAKFAMNQPCSVTGNVVVAAGGTLTHSAQPSGTGTIAGEKNKLFLTVDGSFTVAAGGKVDAQGLGFNSGGPGRGSLAAGHGGRNSETGPSYGSVIHPVNLGSQHSSNGGGAIRLVVSGDCTVNGTVNANGADRDNHYAGSGGSVWITCATLRGSGEISADGGSIPSDTSHAGGGGRIAIYQTAATDEAAFSAGAIHAHGGKSGTTVAAPPGTVYYVHAGEADTEGTLYVENGGSSNGYVELGATTGSDELGFIRTEPGTTVKILAGETVSLHRGYAIAGTFSFGDAASTLALVGPEAAALTGTVRVPRFICEVPNKSITFGSGASDQLTIAANGLFRIIGTDGHLVEVRGATADRGKVNLESGVDQWVEYALVEDMAAPGGEIIAYGSIGQNNENWTFSPIINPGETVTWTAAQGTSDWLDKRNWSPMRVPIKTDVASIPGTAAFQPVLTGPVTLGGLTVQAGARLTIDGGTMILTGPLTVNGSLLIVKRETVTVAGDVTFGAQGSWTGSLGSLTVVPGGATRTVNLGSAQLGLFAVAGGAGTVQFASDVAARRVTFDAAAGAVTAEFKSGSTVTCREFYGLGLMKNAQGELENGLILRGANGGSWNLNATSAALAVGATVNGVNSAWDLATPVAQWIGAANGAWGTAANWSTGAVPDGDTVAVVRDAAALTLPSAGAVKGLVLGGGADAVSATAAGKFTVGTFCVVGDHATLTANKPCEVTNDLVVADGGVMTHALGTANKLDVTVGGNAFLDSYGKLDGSAKSNGGAGTGSITSYGGRITSWSYGWVGKDCYGLFAAPYEPGSTGNSSHYGGGVVKLTAAGTLTLEGEVTADGQHAKTHYTGTGGSVWLTAARIVGGGKVHADGGDLGAGSHGGSGGRIALHQTDSTATDFSAFTGEVHAFGSSSGGKPDGPAGTLYFRCGDEPADGGTLVAWNGTAALRTSMRVELSASMADATVGSLVVSNNVLFVVAPGRTLTLLGDLLTAGRFNGETGSSVIFAGEADATITGANNFEAVSCTVPGKRFFFGTNATDVAKVSATGAVTFQGTEENPVMLLPAGETSTNQWRLSVTDGAVKTFRYLAVSNCVATGVPITAYDSVDLGGNTGWTFVTTPKPGAKLTWTGVVSEDPSDVANWSPARERLETDDVTIPAACDHYPIFTAGNPRFNKLTVAADATLTLNGTSLTVTNAFTVNGTVAVRGAERIAAEGDVTFGNAAAFVAGTGVLALTGAADQQVDPAGAAFYRLCVEKPSGSVTFANGFSADEFRVPAGTDARVIAFAAGSRVACRVFSANGRLTGTAPGLTLTGSGVWTLAASESATALDTALCNSTAENENGFAGGASEDRDGNFGWMFGAHVSVWTGGASSAFATAANWADGIVPGPTSHVAIANATVTAGSPSVASLALSDVSLTATALNVAGNVTVYGASTLSLSRPSVVAGSVVVGSGAKLTHATGSRANKLDLTANGDVTIAAGARVDVKGCGASGSLADSQIPSYGGRMERQGQFGWVGPECFGSLTKPYDQGGYSGNGSRKPNPGGVAKITAGGMLRLDGETDASSADTYDAYQSTGGSVWYTAARIVGGGKVLANGGCTGGSTIGGSGGRIAFYQTDSTATDFSGFTGLVEACGSRTSGGTIVQAPGTVYWCAGNQAEDEGTLVVANADCAAGTNLRVEINSGMTDCAVGTVVVSNNCALVIGADATLTVKGDFLNYGQFRCAEGGELAFAGTEEARIIGSNAVWRLTCVEPGKRLLFGTDARDFTGVLPGGYLTLRGTELGLLELAPADPEGEWRIGGGANLHQDIEWVGVRNSNASNGVPLSALASVDRGNDVSGENVNWNITAPIVPGEEIVWTGETSENWADILNWDRRRAPVMTDRVTIPAGCGRYPSIAIADVAVNALTVAADARLTLAGRALMVTNALTVAGAFAVTGATTVRCEGDVSVTGTFDGPECTLLLAGGRGQTADLGGRAFTEIVAEKSGGTLAFASGFSAATLRLAASAPTTLTFPGLWVVTCGDLYAEGGDGMNLTLRGETDGSGWKLVKRGLGRVRGVRVKNCDASGGDTIYAELPGEDLEGNRNWVFGAKTAVWTGEGAKGDFADGANWSTGEPPDAGTRAMLAPTGTLALTVAGGLSLRELTLGGGGGTVTLTASGPVLLGDSLEVAAGGTAAFNGPVAVSNRVVVRAGGTLTHGACTAHATNRLEMTVGGDVTVEQGGAITANGKGFKDRIGPGFSAQGNAHGGRLATSAARCYGKVAEPVAVGTGGDGYAGGAIRLKAAGTLTVDGTVSADGSYVASGLAGTGGSVWLTAGTIRGAATGRVTANGGGSGSGLAGGGGRVSLVQTAARDFSQWKGKESVSGAGTVFRRAAGTEEGTVTVANASGKGVTELPASGAGDPDKRHRLWAYVVRDGGGLAVTRDVRIRDLLLEDATAKVILGGNTLTITSFEHKDGAGWDPGATVDDSAGGEIVWKRPNGLLIYVK